MRRSRILATVTLLATSATAVAISTPGWSSSTPGPAPSPVVASHYASNGPGAECGGDTCGLGFSQGPSFTIPADRSSYTALSRSRCSTSRARRARSPSAHRWPGAARGIRSRRSRGVDGWGEARRCSRRRWSTGCATFTPATTRSATDPASARTGPITAPSRPIAFWSRSPRQPILGRREVASRPLARALGRRPGRGRLHPTAQHVVQEGGGV
jgi:hypothetical protein